MMRAACNERGARVFVWRPAMAYLCVEGADLGVHLNPIEQLAALRGDLRVPSSAVRTVRVSERSWSELRGLRAPGIGLPGVIYLCTRHGRGMRDFAAVHGRTKAVVVETSPGGFDRLVISRNDAEQKTRMIEQHRGVTR